MRRGAPNVHPGWQGTPCTRKRLAVVALAFAEYYRLASRAYEPPTTMQVTVRTMPATVWTSRVTI